MAKGNSYYFKYCYSNRVIESTLVNGHGAYATKVICTNLICKHFKLLQILFLIDHAKLMLQIKYGFTFFAGCNVDKSTLIGTV